MFTRSEDIDEIFRGSPKVLHSGEGNEFLAASVGQKSVLVLDEEAHAQQRRVLVPPLKGERMRGMFDVYNVLNGNDVLSENNAYGAAWRRPLTVLTGRLFKFGFQLDL